MRRSEGPNHPERAYLSIREVLELLVDEFPEITISKIRFLEGKGLIHPERTPSGYRKFYEDDVERLRWILRQQREHFLPLKVIKGRLEQVSTSATDSSEDSAVVVGELLVEEESQPALVGATALNGAARTARRASRTARPGPESGLPTRPPARRAPVEERSRQQELADEPELVPNSDEVDQSELAIEHTVGAPASASSKVGAKAAGPRQFEDFPPTFAVRPELADLTVHELTAASGAELGLILDLEAFGLIASREVAGERCYDQAALEIAVLAANFGRFGVEPRHLKAFKHAAERDAGLFAQVVVPLLRQHNPAARQRALVELGELVSLGEQLRSAFVQTELKDLTGG